MVDGAVPRSEKYAILAESFSGPLAIAHAARRPVNLKAVILVASFASNPLHPAPQWLSLLAASLLFRLPVSRTVIRAVLLDFSSPPDLVGRVASTIRSVPPQVLSHRLREITRIDMCERLKSISIPILYLAGSRDRLIGQRGVKRMKDQTARLTVSVLDGPHFLLQRNPEAAVREILRFLECLATPRSREEHCQDRS